MEIQIFINDIKEKYFKWLHDISLEAFPRLCDLASDVLSSYLVKNFPNNDVKFIRGRFDIWSHYWITVDGKILDFTIIQFLSNGDKMPSFGSSEVDYYHTYFNKYLNSPFVCGRYYNRYKTYEEIEPSYLACDCIDNFEKYLRWIKDELKEELEFIKDNS